MSKDQPDSIEIQRKHRFEVLALLVAIAVVGFAYLDSLDGPFIWDDLELLQQNCIRSLCSVSEYFKLPFWNQSGQSPGVGMLYRPLSSLSLALDHALHGQNAAGFHLTNVAFHLVNVALLWALARRLGANGFVAAMLVTVWGLLPRLSESVAWISGRTDVLYTTSAILALLVWEPERRLRRIVALALGVVSALTKEAGVCVLLGLVVAESLSAPLGRRVRRAAVPASALLGFLWLRETVTPMAVGRSTIALGLGQRIITVLEAIGRYTWMSLDLWHPRAQIGVVGEPCSGYVGVGILVLIATGLVFFRMRRWQNAFGVFVFVVGTVPLLLVIHLIPMPWVAVVGDRLAYLSWGMAVCGVAVGVTHLAKKTKFAIPLAIAIGTLLVATLFPSVQRRVHLFSDEIAFWVQAVSETRDSNWGPSINLSGLYLRGGLPKQSLRILESLDRGCPFVTEEGTGRAAAKALARQGDYQGAARRLLAENRGNTPELQLFYARLRLAEGDAHAAETLASAALEKQKGYEDANQVKNTLERVKRLVVERSGSVDSKSRSILDAQIDMLSGRLIEAESKWQPLLVMPDLPKSAADEAVAFECALGSARALPSIVAAYANRRDSEPDLLRACKDKIKFAERLQSRWEDVSRILVRKNANAGRCGEYGLFSD